MVILVRGVHPEMIRVPRCVKIIGSSLYNIRTLLTRRSASLRVRLWNGTGRGDESFFSWPDVVLRVSSLVLKIVSLPFRKVFPR